jgi:phosphoenolpyruvate synthase/pyruvate phosphate dikinase
MSAYDEFMNENGWQIALDGGVAWASFQETIDYWLADDLFLTDTVTRRSSLTDLGEAMLGGEVSDELLDDIAAEVVAVWGNDTTMVRFRSSSNAEDSPYFSGAGLYESARGCVADQFDADTTGPSRCDSDKSEESTIADAIKSVWASLWGNAAFEEREWYGIDHSLAAMGVLVNSRSKGELVNIVAFSGDPISDDDRQLINAQDGDYDVVSGEPGLTPEVVRLTIVGGEVVEIDREAHSSLLQQGWLLSHSQLEQLGEALAEIVEVFPIDADIDTERTLLLDTEWKVLSDGRLIIKQIRGFLR